MTTLRALPLEWTTGPTEGEHGVSACSCRPRIPRRRVLVDSPESAADLLAPLLADSDRERCVALLLDTRHRLLTTTTVSIGSIDHTFMSPREVYRDALLGNAAAIVVGHNHPSGDVRPSADDRIVTTRLVDAGELVGVPLLDHLVVAGGDWTSLARMGWC